MADKIKRYTKKAKRRVARRAAKSTRKARFEALYNATAPFRETKKKLISKICSVGVKHRWLRWPSFVAAFIFIFFVNIAFYLCLWILLNKRKAVGLLLVLIAGIGLLIVFKDYGDANKLYSDTRDDYVITWLDEPESEEDVYLTQEEIDNPDYVPSWYDMAQVDFDGLRSINPDIVGWIYFENEAISYPVLYGETDDEYIYTSYDGKSARAGSIFLESRNNPDFGDSHIIIYGHNMRNLSMFGRLRNYYMDTSYYDDHKYFQILTPSKSYRYEIVSCRHVPANDAIYSVYGRDAVGYNDFLMTSVMIDSLIVSDTKPTYEDQIVTLSTCSDGDRRFIVNAMRVDEH